MNKKIMVIVVLVSLLFIVSCSNETDDENQDRAQRVDSGFSEEETASDDYVYVAVGAEIKSFNEDIDQLGYEIHYPETLETGVIFSFMAEKSIGDDPQFLATVISFNTDETPGGQENLLTLLSLQDPTTYINGCEIYEFASTSYFAYCGTEDALQIMTVEMALSEGVDYKSAFGEILGGLVVLN